MRRLAYVFIPMLLCVSLFVARHASADDPWTPYFKTPPDPFTGEYTGRWSASEDVDPDISAQIYALGGNKYHIILATKLAQRCPPKLAIDVEAKDGHLKFEDGNLKGDCDGTTFTGGKRLGDRTFAMKRFVRQPPTMGKPAPAGAVVLFDGKNLDQWDNSLGWKILPDGIMMVTPMSGFLTSKQKFRDLQLHVEFRTPYMPTLRGQGRGNSGVFLDGVYETQVLDSFGLPGYDDECGGLYKVSAPKVNAALPPAVWQVYDITFRAPRYGADGKLTELPHETVYQNGILIHNDQELTEITGHKEKERLSAPPKDPGPIKLQCHGNFVQYRNVWVVPKDEK